jgi:hypothetical protein
VPKDKPAEVSGEPIEVSAGTKRLLASLEGKEASLTIRSEVILRAELIGSVNPVVELMKDGLSYRLRLDMTNMQRPTKLTGQFASQMKKEIVSDEIKAKKALRAWEKIITLEEIEDLKEEDDKSITFFFNEAFNGLALLERIMPKEPKVEVYVTQSDCFELNVEFHKAQQDYSELMATIPFAQQFEVLTRSMAEIEDVLSATGEGLEGVEGEMNKAYEGSPLEKKIGEYIEATEGLSKGLTEALEGINETLKEEREAILKAAETYSKPIKKIKEGIGKSAKTMKKVASTAKDINKYLDIAKNALAAEDMSGADTLRIFGNYFESITEELGPLIETIPVLGVFLKLYAQAIQQIAESVEKIEGVMHDQNRTAKKLRDTGDPWMTPDPYKFMNTAQERLKNDRRKLFDRTETLKNRLIRECRVKVPWSEEYDYLDAIEDAGREAERACKGLEIDYEDRNAILGALKKAWGGYNSARNELKKTGIQNREQAEKKKAEYRKALSFYNYLSRNPKPQELECKRMLRDLDSLNKLRGYNTKAEKSIWLALKSTRGKEMTMINIKDIQTIEKANKQVKRDLRVWDESSGKIRAAKKRLEKAQADEAALRDNNKRYRDCKKKYLRGRARAEKWEMKTVETVHFDLFRGR